MRRVGFFSSVETHSVLNSLVLQSPNLVNLVVTQSNRKTEKLSDTTKGVMLRRVFPVLLLVSVACGQYGAKYAWNGEEAYSWANLNRSHYQITVVHDGVAVDVGIGDGVIRPKNQ